jgi:hypothetical protein
MRTGHPKQSIASFRTDGRWRIGLAITRRFHASWAVVVGLYCYYFGLIFSALALELPHLPKKGICSRQRRKETSRLDARGFCRRDFTKKR